MIWKSLSTIQKDTLERKNQQYLELSNELIELKNFIRRKRKNFSEQTSNFENKTRVNKSVQGSMNDILDAKQFHCKKRVRLVFRSS